MNPVDLIEAEGLRVLSVRHKKHYVIHAQREDGAVKRFVGACSPGRYKRSVKNFRATVRRFARGRDH